MTGFVHVLRCRPAADSSPLTSLRRSPDTSAAAAIEWYGMTSGPSQKCDYMTVLGPHPALRWLDRVASKRSATIPRPEAAGIQTQRGGTSYTSAQRHGTPAPRNDVVRRTSDAAAPRPTSTQPSELRTRTSSGGPIANDGYRRRRSKPASSLKKRAGIGMPTSRSRSNWLPISMTSVLKVSKCA